MARINLSKYMKADARVWSPQQEEIFDWFAHGSGHLLVRARAGTGKTTTLVEGVRRAPERSICVAAFNKSIADELKKRFDGTPIKAMTLHGLGFRFIKSNLPKVVVDARGERARVLAKAGVKVVQDRTEKAAGASGFIVQKIANYGTWIREMLGDPCLIWPEDVIVDGVVDWISNLEAFDEDDWTLGGFWKFERCVEAAIEAVRIAQESIETIDFADMIFLPQVKGWVRPVYQLMVVDEAQDMTRMQLNLGLLSCRGRVCLVGDDRQAIYGFRGADIGCLDRLKDQLDAQELGLTVTYRCPQKVVEVANIFVDDLQAHESAPSGTVRENVKIEKLSEAEEGDFVLSRVNAKLATAFIQLIKSGKRAYLKGNDFGRHLLQFVKRFMSRDLEDLAEEIEEWKKASLDKITERAKKKAVKSEDADKIVSSSAKAKQVEDDCETLLAFIEGSKDYDDLLARLHSSFSDEIDPKAVMCSTVHKAKGLEAKNVWLLGSTFRTYSEEEENICYVAITRAKDTLHLIGGDVAEIFGGDEEEKHLEFEE
jgi:DNA helicase-2/ATP-dependent DNA helicase PcrA